VTAAVDLPAVLPGVDIADGLSHLAGNRAAYRRLLVQFGRNRLEEEAAAALGAGDRVAAVRSVHSLKSVAGNIGAKELSRRAADVESALKAGEETREALAGLAACNRAVLAGIQEWAVRAAGARAAVGRVLDDAGLRRGLEELRELVADNEATALERCEDLAGQCPPEAAGRLRVVQQALAAYDFDAALAGIETLLRGETC
jgi:two-component system, sensor histidine kinase and response regulator